MHRPTFSEVDSVLRYDADTGQLFWKVQRGRCKAGELAGTPSHGYFKIKVLKTLHYAHRLAWLLHHGEWPKHEVDHINMDRGDNRIANLRQATRSQNQMNRKTRSDIFGLKGVRQRRGASRYTAVISKDKKSIALGGYATPEAAYQAYVKAARELHGEFWRP